MKKSLRNMVAVISINYIALFVLSMIILAILEFGLSDGNMDLYLIELRKFSKIIVIPSLGMGVKYLIDKYYR